MPTFSDDVKQQAIKTGLVKQCNRCEGIGSYTATDYNGSPRKVYCGDCNAQGVVLSEVGDFLTFLQTRVLRVKIT